MVQVHPAGFAPGEPAPALVAFAGRAAQRRVRTATPSSKVEEPAGTVVQHPAQRRGAGDHLRGGNGDGRAVLDVAARRVGGMARRLRAGAGRLRGNVSGISGRAGGGDGIGADVTMTWYTSGSSAPAT